ncbi:MAG: DUF3822 family protein [Sphingobacteriaceae bacterium]|nr:MAG: DUF3822 family protein [Sphingobacteriaceae bacterium]
MNDTRYSYHDDVFSLKQAGSYVLLLQIHAGTFSYAVTFNNRLLSWSTGHPVKELTEPEELDDLLSAPFKQVIVGIPAAGFTLIPETLYNDAHLQHFARFLNVQADEKVFVQQIDSENRIVYKVTDAINTAAAKFGLPSSVFAAKGWIKAIAATNPEDYTLYADINGNKITLLNYSFGKLRYFNSFKFYNADELAYYAALACEQLKLQPKRITVSLSGEAEKDDANTQRLAQFFEKVNINDLSILKLPAQVAPQHILSLSALTLCG